MEAESKKKKNYVLSKPNLMKEMIEKKLKRITYFQVSDTTNDNIKNRCIYPIFLLIYYIILIFLVVNLITSVLLLFFVF